MLALLIFQAARDGLVDVVRAHLDVSCAQLLDVDEDGFTALHHAARYNRVRVMESLVEAGGGKLSVQIV